MESPYVHIPVAVETAVTHNVGQGISTGLNVSLALIELLLV
jgi:hypothetical protein